MNMAIGFFHCHILYHLEAGMARVVSYGTPRDPRMKEFPASTAVADTDQFFLLGELLMLLQI